MTFVYTKKLKLIKSNTICVMFFKYKNPNTVSNLNVIELIEFAERWEFLYSKNNALCVEFLYAKNNLFFITFLFQEGIQVDTLRHIFITKNNALCVTFIYINYCIVYYIFEL